MSNLLVWLDGKTRLMPILFLFWAIFWGMNGGDKFFNGASLANLEPWSAKSVLVDRNGQIAYRQHPILPQGLYGITRDAKMTNYFARIGLPKWLALASLYVLGVFEVVLGLVFLALLAWSALPRVTRERKTGRLRHFTDRTIHRLAFKGGIIIFLLFALGDILFGDRAELWEHGTYMVLCLITYDLWYRTDRYVRLIEQGKVPEHAL